ncbi:hypothetical protein RRG08_045827, partial [Elysia crispata]
AFVSNSPINVGFELNKYELSGLCLYLSTSKSSTNDNVDLNLGRKSVSLKTVALPFDIQIIH